MVLIAVGLIPTLSHTTMEPCGPRNCSLSANLLKKSSLRPKLFATASSCYCGHIVRVRVSLLIMAGAKCSRESIFGQNLFSLLKTKKFVIVISTIRGLIPDSCRPYIILYDHHKKPFYSRKIHPENVVVVNMRRNCSSRNFTHGVKDRTSQTGKIWQNIKI